MAENARTGFVWKTFMKNEKALNALQKAGFRVIAGVRPSARG